MTLSHHSTRISEVLTAFQTTYPPADDFAAQANATAELYAEAEKDRLTFWAKQANRLSWDIPFDEVLDWSEAPVREVVRRRQAQRRLQLRRPTRRGGQRGPGGDPLGGRAQG